MTFFGIGFRRKRKETILDTIYPSIKSNKDELTQLKSALNITQNGIVELTQDQFQAARDLLFLDLPIEGVEATKSDYYKVDAILFILDDIQSDIHSTEDAYFRLQLLSHRLVKPHGQNLNGIFGQLPNIAWTNKGPVLPDDLSHFKTSQLLKGNDVVVTHVDKFPYMVNYHVPSGVRIADASRVRLGAYLGEGTTIMPAGFVNFNAGTMGNAMVEGRISAGVVVDTDSDIGGGASIMGTLSGGNNHVISVGKKCLLGANSGIGISLGDGCTVAAGAYVSAGKKVSLFNDSNQPIDINNNIVNAGENIVKAAELSGTSFKLFIEDSQTGELVCKPNTKVIQLNEALHLNT